MKLILTVAAIVMTLGGPAWAEETLFCVDTDANGFEWKDGKNKRTGYTPQRFTVRVVSKTERWIKFSPMPKAIRYNCRHRVAGTFYCNLSSNTAILPIIFEGNRFERVKNGGEHVGGYGDLYVAYGTCTKF
jgi:hypothetical protein